MDKTFLCGVFVEQNADRADLYVYSSEGRSMPWAGTSTLFHAYQPPIEYAKFICNALDLLYSRLHPLLSDTSKYTLQAYFGYDEKP